MDPSSARVMTANELRSGLEWSRSAVNLRWTSGGFANAPIVFPLAIPFVVRTSSRTARLFSHAHAQAVNHGIPQSLLDNVVAKGREMFSLPKAEKLKFKVRRCRILSRSLGKASVTRRINGVLVTISQAPKVASFSLRGPLRPSHVGTNTACGRRYYQLAHIGAYPSIACLCGWLPARPLFVLSARCFPQRTATNARGWYDDELTKRTRDWKEGFDFGHVPDADLPPDHPTNIVQDGYNQWPGESTPLFKVGDRWVHMWMPGASYSEITAAVAIQST